MSIFQIECLSLQTLERLTKVAKRLFDETRQPTLKMLYAASLRGLREEIRRREVEHRDLRPTLKDDWEEDYRHLLKTTTNTPS